MGGGELRAPTRLGRKRDTLGERGALRSRQARQGDDLVARDTSRVRARESRPRPQIPPTLGLEARDRARDALGIRRVDEPEGSPHARIETAFHPRCEPHGSRAPRHGSLGMEVGLVEADPVECQPAVDRIEFGEPTLASAGQATESSQAQPAPMWTM